MLCIGVYGGVVQKWMDGWKGQTEEEGKYIREREKRAGLKGQTGEEGTVHRGDGNCKVRQGRKGR